MGLLRGTVAVEHSVQENGSRWYTPSLQTGPPARTQHRAHQAKSRVPGRPSPLRTTAPLVCVWPQLRAGCADFLHVLLPLQKSDTPHGDPRLSVSADI